MSDVRKKMTLKEFIKKLKEQHGLKEVYQKRWSNYPHSVFFYDTPDFDGATANIGIYTDETTYSLTSA